MAYNEQNVYKAIGFDPRAITPSGEKIARTLQSPIVSPAGNTSTIDYSSPQYNREFTRTSAPSVSAAPQKAITVEDMLKEQNSGLNSASWASPKTAPTSSSNINVTRGKNGVLEFSGQNIGPNDAISYSQPWTSGVKIPGARGGSSGTGGLSVIPFATGQQAGGVPFAENLQRAVADLESPDQAIRNRALNRIGVLSKASGAMDARYGPDTNYSIAGLNADAMMGRTQAEIEAQRGTREAMAKYYDRQSSNTPDPMDIYKTISGENAGMMAAQRAIVERNNAMYSALISSGQYDPTKPENATNDVKRLLAQMDRDEKVLRGQQEQGQIIRQKYAPGVEGKAEGGMISAMGPQENPAAQLYGQYVATAMKAGVQPLPMDKFSNLLMQTRAQLMAAPAQMAPGTMPQNPGAGAPMGFAEGGGVMGWLAEKLYGSKTSPQTPQGQQPVPTPNPNLLGTGQARGAASAIQGRQQQLEAQLRAQGYAGGGTINVDGQQVFGPGTGKSDSIPAVIDGTRPAALSTGEFVMPVEAVQFFGLQRLNKMVEQARKGNIQEEGEDD